MSSNSGALSPSEAFQAAAQRSAESKTYLGTFAQSLEFELDEFQRDACRSLQEGR
jgi:ATP-dependent RNA helicase HelY